MTRRAQDVGASCPLRRFERRAGRRWTRRRLRSFRAPFPSADLIFPKAGCAMARRLRTALAGDAFGLGTRAGGRFVVVGDAAYPAALAALPDAPPVLSAIGDLGLLCRPDPGDRGRARGLAGRASLRRRDGGGAGRGRLRRGLGPGARHRRGGPRGRPATGTVAVLAGGIDQVYPPPERRPPRRDRCARPAAQRIAARHATGRPRLPAPQPHRQRPVEPACW